MEELHLLEELDMLPDGGRFDRVRRDLFETLSDKEFFALTRFTKDGVRRLTERLDARLRTQSNRGQPVPPVDQVHKFLSDQYPPTPFPIHIHQTTQHHTTHTIHLSPHTTHTTSNCQNRLYDMKKVIYLGLHLSRNYGW